MTERVNDEICVRPFCLLGEGLVVAINVTASQRWAWRMSKRGGRDVARLRPLRGQTPPLLLLPLSLPRYILCASGDHRALLSTAEWIGIGNTWRERGRGKSENVQIEGGAYQAKQSKKMEKLGFDACEKRLFPHCSFILGFIVSSIAFIVDLLLNSFMTVPSS